MSVYHTGAAARVPASIMRIRLFAFVTLIFLLAAPSAYGDFLYLRDGTVLRGTLVRVTADSLGFRTSFGPIVRVERARVARVVFGGASEEVTPAPARERAHPASIARDDRATGSVIVTFRNRSVSSKIRVDRGRDLAGHMRANRLMEILLVDGDTAYVHIDSTVDKTVYQGPKRFYKNTITLKDISVQVAAGVHQCTLLVANVDGDRYADRFDPAPLSLEFGLGEVRVPPHGTARFHLGLRRGKLLLGRPEFYLVK